jgi:hypothetical protein
MGKRDVRGYMVEGKEDGEDTRRIHRETDLCSEKPDHHYGPF